MLGQPREEFLEAADLDLGENSLRKAENIRIKATRTIAQRYGTEYLREVIAYTQHFEIRPADGLTYALEINSLGQLQVLDQSASVIWSTTIGILSPDEQNSLWVAPFGYQTVIGTSDRLLVLTYSGGTFSVGALTFDAAPGNELAQPYWSFVQGLTLTPSALTGSITVTASAALFSAAWVGMRIRYANREILITGYTSPTVVSGTVLSQLPPTYILTLSTTSGFSVGDVIVGLTTDFQGLIVGVAGLDISVITLNFFDGPDVAEKLTSPSGSATVSAKTTTTPAPSPIWDEPLVSPVRGYPRSGVSAGGRLFLCDFPEAPDAIACSSVRSITDFRVGDEDDDAIARAIGDNRPRLLHVANAGDILIFADRGCYLISLKDGTALTPSSFNPLLFDARGCSTARPAVVDNGVVFIEASGKAIAAATLSGNIYMKWSVRTLSTFHAQLFSDPVSVCGPPADCVLEDKHLFVINSDGTMVAMSWVDSFDAESVGFVPWTTAGNYARAVPMFGGYWFLVNRMLGAPAVSRALVEKLSQTAIMDCETDASSGIFTKTVMHLAGDGWYAGEIEVIGISIPEVASYPVDARVGFNFVSKVMPWPKRMIQHPKAGLLPCRVIRVSAATLSTGVFQIRCNNSTRDFNGYFFGDDLSEPAANRTKICRASVVGRRVYPEIEFIKPYPSQMQILAITQEVSY